MRTQWGVSYDNRGRDKLVVKKCQEFPKIPEAKSMCMK